MTIKSFFTKIEISPTFVKSQGKHVPTVVLGQLAPRKIALNPKLNPYQGVGWRWGGIILGGSCQDTACVIDLNHLNISSKKFRNVFKSMIKPIHSSLLCFEQNNQFTPAGCLNRRFLTDFLIFDCSLLGNSLKKIFFWHQLCLTLC